MKDGSRTYSLSMRDSMRVPQPGLAADFGPAWVRYFAKLLGEELPRSSLDPGDSLEKAGIMAGIIGRSKRVGGGQSANTRWACRQSLKPSGLPHRNASRESRLITTWRSIHTQITCLKFVTFSMPECVPMARFGVTVSAIRNREARK
jgi:hypothetical protein